MKKVKLFFDPVTHTYWDEDDGNKNYYTSATQLIGQYSPPYDSEFWAVYRALDQFGHKLVPNTDTRTIKVHRALWDTVGWGDTEEYREFSLQELINGAVPMNWTKDQIVAEWKAIAAKAINWGNEKHGYLEDCINRFYTDNKNSQWSPATYNHDLGFRAKIASIEELRNSPLRDSHLTVYDLLVKFIRGGWVLFAEKRVYSSEHKISGTIDVIAVKDNKFYIIDWKTNKDELKFRAGYYKSEWRLDAYGNRVEKVKTNKFVATNEKFLRPLNVVYCKGNVYRLQLSLYAYLCELWGMEHQGNILVHIRHDGNGKELEPIIHYPKTMLYLKNDISRLVAVHKAKLSGKASAYRGAITNL